MYSIPSQVPALMSLYWATSSSFGLLQNLAFKAPRVRRLLQIPKVSSEKAHPYREISRQVAVKMKARIDSKNDKTGAT